MKRVLHVIESLGVGGAEKLLVTILNELPGYELHLIVLSKPDTLRTSIPAHVKVTYCEFRLNRQILGMRRFLKKYIRENKIDIVHSHLYWANIVARLATPKKITLFNHIQAISSAASYQVDKKSWWLEKWTYKKRHHIIAVSKEVLDDFDKWIKIKGPSTVMYNIIDEKYFKGQPKTDFTGEGLRLVAVGNLRWQKNYPYILEAFKNMPAGVSLDIYGEGGLRAEFQAIIDRDHLAIRLCGLRDNLEAILPTYDAFIMCSLYEGFSLGLMEAMACGLPALLSDIPVLKEAGGDAARYFSLDNPADAVVCVNKMLADKSQLAVMSQQGWDRARSMAKKDELIRQLDTLYRKS